MNDGRPRHSCNDSRLTGIQAGSRCRYSLTEQQRRLETHSYCPAALGSGAIPYTVQYSRVPSLLKPFFHPNPIGRPPLQTGGIFRNVEINFSAQMIGLSCLKIWYKLVPPLPNCAKTENGRFGSQ